jgi:hypothetical protein
VDGDGLGNGCAELAKSAVNKSVALLGKIPFLMQELVDGPISYLNLD